MVKEFSRIQAGGNMNSQEPIRILGAIDLDNEFIRNYTESMKEFLKRAKPFPKDSIIEKHFRPHVYVSSTEEEHTPLNTNKKRKTRKRKY